MDDEGSGCGARGEAVVVLRVFEDLPDPRQRAKVVHPRDEILLLCMLAVLAGAGTITDMARFTITSLTLPAHSLGAIVRSHWAVENSLHGVMDMVFRDDECRVRTHNAPANFTTRKHSALNLIPTTPGKDSLRLKRKVAAWDDDFLAAIVTQ